MSPAGPAAPAGAPRPRRLGLKAAAGAGLAVALGGALLAGGAFAGLEILRRRAPPPPAPAVSTEVVDREGRLLRPFALPDGRWRLAAGPQDVDPRLLAMILAYEDKRFAAHGGIDPLALGRAAWQAATRGRVVSGASTLTMQVARLTAPARPRTLAAKFAQMRRALELEARLSKAEILRLYLTLAPYGGNLEGVRAASLAYFGKEPRRLTLGESALLVALPQSPEARRPDRAPEAARRARNLVLDRLAAAGAVSPDEARLAKAEPVPAARRALPGLAPHASEEAVAQRPGRARHRLALDAPLQERLEELVRERAASLGQGLSAALLVVDTAGAEVRAYVGSADFSDRERAGQVDLARAVRSPGSTLKPFIYGLAFEDGLAHPETLIEDAPVRFGSYRPENFDMTFQGTVSLRRALQMSLNVPAVRLLDAVGPQRLATRLAGAGARLELPAGAAPALPMGLGGVGLRLTDLALLYSALARGGEARRLVLRLDDGPAAPARPARLLDGVAAWHVADALRGTPAPDHALGGRIAFKTGTSYGYRDSWAVGFDGRRTVAVWVGRPDGQSVPGLTGRSAAAPLLFDAFARIVRTPAPLPAAPKGVLVQASGRLPPPLRRFGGFRPEGRGLHVVFPPDGARLAGESAEADTQGLVPALAPVAVKVEGGAPPLTVLADGRPVARAEDGRTLFWTPRGRGFVRLTVVDQDGLTDSVTVRIE